MEIRTANKIRKIGKILFLLYMLAVVYLMFFFEKYDRTLADRQYLFNLVPFREIRRFIVYRDVLGTSVVIENLIGNIIGFVPFGYILPLIYKNKRKFWLITLLTAEFSLFIELTQLMLRVGSCDIDNIILNTCGGMLGYGLFFISNRIRRKIDG